MKTITNFVMILAAVTLFAACGNSEKPVAEASKGDDVVPVEKTAVVVSLKDDKLNAVYPHYVQLTNALVNGDMTEAKVAVSAIELGSKELNNGGVLATLAAKIGAAKDIEAQRTWFADLSADFIERVKSTGLNTGEIYVEYCPMALNDKGAAWLSTQKEIRNPYFGESMMTCGEVKETLK
ncbi:MAG: DUF3347 domain-containing protein [Bacteroidota bacterium]